MVIFAGLDLLRDRIWVRIHLDLPNFAERTRKAPLWYRPDNNGKCFFGRNWHPNSIHIDQRTARSYTIGNLESKNYASGPLLIGVDLGGWVRGTRPTAKQSSSKSGCDRCMSLQNGRKNMFLRNLSPVIALAVAGDANLTTALRKTAFIYQFCHIGLVHLLVAVFQLQMDLLTT